MAKSVKLPDSKEKREVHSASSYARSIVEASLDPPATIGAEEKITPSTKSLTTQQVVLDYK